MAFRILKKLGTKTKRKFNEVYLVEFIENKELGVLKQLFKTDSNMHIQELLRHEAQFEFETKNLPKTLYYEETETQISLIKNYYEGVSLDIYWKKISKKDRISFLALFLQKLIPVFQELKSQSIVHGDIKPGNFILNGVGLDFDVSLIDFGLSFQPTDFENHLKTRKVVFALGFSAPELIINKLYLAEQATDIFALGICFYFLFEGKLPLSHANPAVMTNLQLVHPILKPNSIPKDLFQIIEKMCYKKSFAKPVNLLTTEEVDLNLRLGISKRYHNLEVVYNEVHAIQFKSKRTLYHKLIKVFSNTKIKVKK